MKCVAERSKSLIETSFTKRQYDLLIKIRGIKGDVNARGALNSSMCVNEVCKACVTELQEFSEQIYAAIKRAHQSCGNGYSKSVESELTNLFENYLKDAKAKLNGVQEESVGTIARHRQNKKLLQFEWLEDESGRLLSKFKTEIAMYVDSLRHSSGSNRVERLKNSFFNHKLVAVGVLVIATIVMLGAFTGAIQSISNWISGILK